jgi:hypothetical protein
MAFVTFSILELYAPFFRSTDQLKVAGGFISSLIFFWSMIGLGSIMNELQWGSGKMTVQ